MDPSSKSRMESSISTSILLDYSNDQLVIPNHWNSSFHVLLIFGTDKTQPEDIANIYKLIKRIGSFIRSYPVESKLSSIDFVPVIEKLWKLIKIIYTSK